MYATDAGPTPATVTPPPVHKDNPAAGTTGIPTPVTPGAGFAVTRDGKMTVPAAVLVWTLGGLAVVLGIHAVFRGGGLG